MKALPQPQSTPVALSPAPRPPAEAAASIEGFDDWCRPIGLSYRVMAVLLEGRPPRRGRSSISKLAENVSKAPPSSLPPPARWCSRKMHCGDAKVYGISGLSTGFGSGRDGNKISSKHRDSRPLMSPVPPDSMGTGQDAADWTYNEALEPGSGGNERQECPLSTQPRRGSPSVSDNPTDQLKLLPFQKNKAADMSEVTEGILLRGRCSNRSVNPQQQQRQASQREKSDHQSALSEGKVEGIAVACSTAREKGNISMGCRHVLSACHNGGDALTVEPATHSVPARRDCATSPFMLKSCTTTFTVIAVNKGADAFDNGKDSQYPLHCSPLAVRVAVPTDALDGHVVRDIKLCVESQIGVNAKHQTLWAGGVVLRDDVPLSFFEPSSTFLMDVDTSREPHSCAGEVKRAKLLHAVAEERLSAREYETRLTDLSLPAATVTPRDREAVLLHPDGSSSAQDFDDVCVPCFDRAIFPKPADAQAPDMDDCDLWKSQKEGPCREATCGTARPGSESPPQRVMDQSSIDGCSVANSEDGTTRACSLLHVSISPSSTATESGFDCRNASCKTLPPSEVTEVEKQMELTLSAYGDDSSPSLKGTEMSSGKRKLVERRKVLEEAIAEAQHQMKLLAWICSRQTNTEAVDKGKMNSHAVEC
ncbi:hypothetical protein ERJ75_000417200 [Trypanosoma vivax]|uniref:Ubiquitin-like domain-containing protein n=1 Tax=Trypanosoma vivax (strain Y486) TaxID=1055687 RepID=G0TZH8_TRYVY|nr:hypothetical protein ERJ75_000417200 [Trypanosoma vivax]CCC49382.1 conserved hypothetical protein [Trypanosoma vivax Y486]